MTQSTIPTGDLKPSPFKFNATALTFRPSTRISTRSKEQGSSLYTLPFELLLKIIQYCTAARDVASLSQTCKRMLQLTKVQGWKVFCIERFPSLLKDVTLYDQAEWMRLADRLTGFSQGMDRRHILAKPFDKEESGVTYHKESLLQCVVTEDYTCDSNAEIFDYRSGELRHTRPAVTGRQTANFHPQITSSENMECGTQMIVVAWSSGSDLNLRIDSAVSKQKSRGKVPPRSCHAYQITAQCFDSAVHDITSLSTVSSAVASEHRFIVGRASAHLHQVKVSSKHGSNRKQCYVENAFSRSWNHLAVRATDTFGTSLVAVGEGCSVTLWNTISSDFQIHPSSELQLKSAESFTTTWDVRFTSPDQVVVGLGSSAKPLVLCRIEGGNILEMSRLGCDVIDDSHVINETTKKRSVYSIQPLPPLSRAAGSKAGDTFLTGWFDGFCRLYDIRAAQSPVMTYHDPIDSDSAVYSLASFGLETFMAGTANGLLKIFDFRNGHKAYSYAEAQPCSNKIPFPHNRAAKRFHSRTGKDVVTKNSSSCVYHTAARQSWFVPNANIFVNGRSNTLFARGRGNEPHRTLARDEGPLFSLSIPSPSSPYIIVGAQGLVYELEISYGKAPKIAHTPLSMYETSEGVGTSILSREASIMPILRTQDFNTNPKISRQGLNRTRLGEMWLKDHEIMSLW